MGVNQTSSLTNAFVFFLNRRFFSEIYKKGDNNPLLSKSMLKYPGYSQIFWVEVRRLKDQWMSIWALVFF